MNVCSLVKIFWRCFRIPPSWSDCGTPGYFIKGSLRRSKTRALDEASPLCAASELTRGGNAFFDWSEVTRGAF
jgi:hypothetical protein